MERSVAGDTVRHVVDARSGRWLDAAPAGVLACYRVRPRLAHRQGEWSEPLWMGSPAPASASAPRRLRVGEWRPFTRDGGPPPPQDPEWVEGRGGRPRDDALLTGISPREALAYCNWLNGRMGRSGRYDDEGRWTAGPSGGWRLPRPGEGGGPGRVWVQDETGFRAEGESDLRAGSPRRLYHPDARQPDVGLALVADLSPR